MSEEKALKKAQKMYENLLEFLDENDWRYNIDKENLSVYIGVNTKDIPVHYSLSVVPNKAILLLYSILPFSVPKEKIVDVAIALTLINECLCDGNFELNLVDGTLSFKLSTCYRDSLISPLVFDYMMDIAYHTINDFNDKLSDIVEGKLTVEAFLAQFNEAE